MLEKNELDLCKVARVYGTLTDENKSKLLSDVRCRSYRKIDEIVTSYNPKSLLRDRVRPVYIKKPVQDLIEVFKPVTVTEPKSARKSTANVWLSEKSNFGR